MIYTTGTIAINGNTVTGTGTDFTAPLSLIRVGCTLIAVSDPIQIFTITEIKSGTELSVTPAANPAIPAGTKFSILLSDSISVDGLAQDVAETLRYYQGKETEIAEAIEFFQEFDFNALTTLANQVHTDSAQVSADKATVQQYKTDSESAKSAAEAAKDQAALAQTAAETANTNAQAASDAAKGYRNEAEQFKNAIDPSQLLAKGNNLSDVANPAAARENLEIDRFKQSSNDTTILDHEGQYTFFLASTDWGYFINSTRERVPLGILSGGTGGATTDSACHNLRALNYAYPPTINYSSPELYTGIGFYADDTSPWPGGNGSPYPYTEIMTVAEGGGGPGSVGNWSQIAFSTITQQAPRYRQRFSNPAQITEWRDFLVRDLNTTVDSNGFIKIASPIVKIKGDGSAELNDESEGCTVTRVEKGVYLISGCLGLNSDASWGGIDGGFEIPVDINKQPLIWIDYKVLSDGSIELRTYHRTYQESPVFARNIIEGINDGDPIDIPPGTYVSVRVEMPSSDTQATVHL